MQKMGWCSSIYGNQSRVLTPDDPFAMFINWKFGQVILQVLDVDFCQSKRETSDVEWVEISSYHGDSIVNLNTVLSMCRVVAQDLPSCEAILSAYEQWGGYQWEGKFFDNKTSVVLDKQILKKVCEV